jgi:flavin reductase (DIM6/NTAB) family NADH-FMN oxidoreductase RutF
MALETRPRTIDPTRFREVLGNYATGVTVVTSMNGGMPIGTTVNSFTSVSLDPAMVLVCIGRERTIHPVLAATGRFTVNILREDGQDLSDCFAGAPSELPREAFCDAAYRIGDNATPILASALAHLDCTVERTLEAGDHTIYLARVTDLESHDRAALPLLYFRGRYLRIERAEASELRGKPDA